MDKFSGSLEKNIRKYPTLDVRFLCIVCFVSMLVRRGGDFYLGSNSSIAAPFNWQEVRLRAVLYSITYIKWTSCAGSVSFLVPLSQSILFRLICICSYNLIGWKRVHCSLPYELISAWSIITQQINRKKVFFSKRSLPLSHQLLKYNTFRV